MTDDKFLARLRDEAQKLQFEPDDIMTARIAARVRGSLAREAQGGVAQILALWFRPVVASLATLALAAMLSVGWLELSRDAAPSTGLDSMTSTQSVDISVGGDTFSVE
jgi:hypothetical protein